MASPLVMHTAFFSLILIVLADCRPRLRDPQQQPHHLSGSMKGSIDRDLLIVWPVIDTSNFVSIFDLKRKTFLCVNSKEELYKSRRRDNRDCMFQRIWLDTLNHRDVFYSTIGGQTLKVQRNKVRAVHQEPHGASSAALHRLEKRQRRSEEVNPSDPLRSQSHQSYFGRNLRARFHGQPEREKAGAVSKETITSCDDPLRVLQSNGPVSPVKTNIADWSIV